MSTCVVNIVNPDHPVICLREFKWRINKVTSFINSARSTEGTARLNSPKFSIIAPASHSWYLKLKINNDEASKTKSWISVRIYPKNENQTIIKNRIISIINHQGIKFFSQLQNKTLIKKNDQNFEVLINIDELLKRKNEFLLNDSLTLCVNLQIVDDRKSVARTIEPLKSLKRKMSDDFENLFNAKKRCDIAIKVGEEKFDAHKIILSTRSCVFDGMFSHTMKENKENEVTIPDINPEVFKKVLDYIYTDKVEELDNFAEELLNASEKYQLQGLKEMCEDSLSRSVTVENAIKVLISADRYNAIRLKDFVVNYVAIKLIQFKSTEEYKALKDTHPGLLLEILMKFSDEVENK